MNPYPPCILVCSDLPVLCAGYTEQLQKETSFNVISLPPGEELVGFVRSIAPDLVLLDLAQFRINGIEALQLLKSKCAGINVLSVSDTADPDMLVRIFNAGSKGHLLHSCSAEEFAEAVCTVMEGRQYSFTGIGAQMREAVLRSSVLLPGNANRFSETELAVIKGICKDLSNAELAAYAYCSRKSIGKVRARIMKKMGVSTTVGLVKYAITKGLYL